MKKIERSNTLSPLFLELFPIALGKGERTKMRILEATIENIAESGIASTGFESVGQRVGLARRNVAYHFPRVEEMILAAIQLTIMNGQKLIVERLKTSKTWKSRLQMYFKGMFEWIELYPTHGRVFVAFHHLASVDPKFKEEFLEITGAGMARVQTILKESPASAHSDEAAEVVHALLVGMIIRHSVTGSAGSSNAVANRGFKAALGILKAF
jgi:AcrR family transcriptional regulator